MSEFGDVSEEPDPPRRGRGRPKGSKNKRPYPKPEVPQVAPGNREVPPGGDPFDDYRHSDPLAIVSRQYAMLDWAQQALRNQLKIGIGAKDGIRVAAHDVQTLMDLSATTIRALDGHKKALALAEELAKQKSPAELLEICIKRIEGQDLPTLQAVIRRLKEHRAKLAPITRRDNKMMEGIYKPRSAVEEMAELGEEPGEV